MKNEFIVEVSGSEMNGYNIFNESSFQRFVPEGYMIKEINFFQEEEFNNPYHFGESVFLVVVKKIGF